jgi:two-component system, chemotaxis family, chemotaxis protein CheY
MNALVVDDSTAVRRLSKKALSEAGWQVTEAVNGREALAALVAMPACELIVTDWHMPEMDGMALVRAVRAEARWNHVRILMVTSDGVMDSIQAALAAGASDFIVKPFSPAALAERVVELVRSHV